MANQNALRELLADAVQNICNRHKEDLKEAVAELQKDISRLEKALNQTQAADDQSRGFAASVVARSIPAQDLGEDGSHTQNPTLDGSYSRVENALDKSVGKEPSLASRSQSKSMQRGRSSTSSARSDVSCPSVRKSRSSHGYSAAHMMELLSGGAPPSSSLRATQQKASSVLFVCVMISVAVSTLSLGVSFDVEPESDFWLALETVCVLVFVVEFFVKVVFLEKWAYFFGPKYESAALNRRTTKKNLTDWNQLHNNEKEAWITSFWNWFDFSVTTIAVLDLIVTLIGFKGGSGAIAALRCARLFRALRIVKLLRIPLVKDMMDIFIGLILGTPLLVGAFCLLLGTVYLAAIAFRLMFGPSIEAGGGCDKFEKGMNTTEFSDDCHWLEKHEYYTYMYFGTVDQAMFTLFRCMTIDCSTKDGRSLVAILSHGYGKPFDLYWSILTIWIICGILNIIQASFVGKTTSQIEARESSYVLHQLRCLATEVVDWATSRDLVHACAASGLGKVVSTPAGQSQWPRRGEVSLSVDQFEELMSDVNKVKSIIRGLGMDISAKELFTILDMDESGSVDAVEVLDSLMMLSRIQQAGTISTLIALHGLSGKMNEITAWRDPVSAARMELRQGIQPHQE